MMANIKIEEVKEILAAVNFTGYNDNCLLKL